ncbi:potassium channel family protein [Arthrobacter sp. TMN-37]
MTSEMWRARTEWPLAGAAVLFLLIYSVQVIAPLSAAEASALAAANSVIWAVFLLDFVVNLALAERRWHWLLRNLHELLILVLPMLRPLRLLRLLTLLRVLNRAGGDALRGRLALYVLASAVILSYASALAVLDVEQDAPEGNILTIGDALWWSLTTVTSVGYGDHFPVTVPGRLVASGLMVLGIAVLGVVTATVASWLVESVSTGSADDSADAVQRELAAVRAQLTELTDQLAARRGPPE